MICKLTAVDLSPVALSLPLSFSLDVTLACECSVCFILILHALHGKKVCKSTWDFSLLFSCENRQQWKKFCQKSVERCKAENRRDLKFLFEVSLYRTKQRKAINLKCNLKILFHSKMVGKFHNEKVFKNINLLGSIQTLCKRTFIKVFLLS